jgi:hypothetical protein
MVALALAPSAPCKRRVRVWFGEHPIMTYVGLAASAERYELAMRRRFVGLKVTNEPVDVGLSAAAADVSLGPERGR